MCKDATRLSVPPVVRATRRRPMGRASRTAASGGEGRHRYFVCSRECTARAHLPLPRPPRPKRTKSCSVPRKNHARRRLGSVCLQVATGSGLWARCARRLVRRSTTVGPVQGAQQRSPVRLHPTTILMATVEEAAEGEALTAIAAVSVSPSKVKAQPKARSTSGRCPS